MHLVTQANAYVRSARDMRRVLRGVATSWNRLTNQITAAYVWLNNPLI